MHSLEIKKKYIEFFRKKGHKQLANVSLLPDNDPTALFINSGVHPIVPNILQGSHPLGKRLCSIQRCIRTTDIEETGDNRHHTLFEMLGNWSIGDYFKNESLNWSMKFFVEVLKLDPKRIYASVFKGEKGVPRDEQSIAVWKEIFKKYGISAEVYDETKKDNSNARIFPLGKEDNFWGPAGQTGPCGPNSEFFYYFMKDSPDFSRSRPGFRDGDEYVELWNNVFMEYNKDSSGALTPLKQKNVDTGAGFERICLVIQNREKDGSMDPKHTVYDTDLFDSPLAYIRSLIEDESKKSNYEANREDTIEFDPTLTDIEDVESAIRSIRITLDHLRASTFLIADGVEPSNKDHGYILRRLIRRAIRHAKLLRINQNFTKDLAKLYIEKYKPQYPHLATNSQKITDILEKEEINFEQTIQRGIREVEKLKGKGGEVSGKDLFFIYETYGYPLEMALDGLQIREEKEREKYIKEFNVAKSFHQKESRKGAVKFAGGLADHTEISKRYHTVTHILLKALQISLGQHVHQRGSNITEERLRFDFSHPEKLTQEQIGKVEEIVNKQIESGLEMERKVMPKEEALKTGAECEFPERYPATVSVYVLKDPKTGKVFSQEFCGGPHVDNTKELSESGKFKIIKEESSSSGVRRIRAILTK
ncbi:MAG: alanine--tRNA ligase [Candidatus Dojkabacteria bacterium]|nr:alanine--tRNA ligase [Candidatus Dojkabacteria bacterium]